MMLPASPELSAYQGVSTLLAAEMTWLETTVLFVTTAVVPVPPVPVSNCVICVPATTEPVALS